MKSLRAELGREPLETTKAAALLLAEALTRPEQFREVLDGLEALKPGVGRHTAELLRATRGVGDKKLIAALHEAGARKSKAAPFSYPAGGWFDLFDAGSIDGRDGLVLDAPAAGTSGGGAGPRARPRAADLASPARP